MTSMPRAARLPKHASRNLSASWPSSTKEMPMASETDLSTPQARRRANTDVRLREALSVLANNASTAPTVAGLAQAAEVGRNIIYTHIAGGLDALRELQSQSHGAAEQAAGKAEPTRSAFRDCYRSGVVEG